MPSGSAPRNRVRVVLVVLNDMTSDPRVMKEARTLASSGYAVAIVCQQTEGLPPVEQVDDVTIHRMSTPGRVSWRYPLSKLREFARRERELAEAIASLEPDVVHCNDTPTLTAGARAARECGAALVYDAHELYPDSLMQRKYQRSRLVQRYWRSVERRLVPAADAVITVSPGHREKLRERFGVEAAIVANVPPLEPRCHGSRVRRELGIGDDVPLLLYQGGLLSVGRSVDELLQVVERIPEVFLVVQGSGAGLESARARAKDLGISDRVYFMGQLHPSSLHEYTCGVDIGTAFIDGLTLNHQLTWPNRIFMYMMAGVPIAATDVPGMSSLVHDLGIGTTAAPKDVDDMERAVRELLDDPGARAEMGRRAREAAEREYNWEVASRELLRVYEAFDRRPAAS